jgi:hypothetical protein
MCKRHNKLQEIQDYKLISFTMRSNYITILKHVIHGGTAMKYLGLDNYECDCLHCFFITKYM